MAWAWAWQRVKNPHATHERRGYKEAIADTRWAWEAAYRNEDVPHAGSLARLLEVLDILRDEDHDPAPVREPPMVITGKQHRHALDFVTAKAS